MAGAVNLRMLSYLVALDDTRHFGKAADRCHVSQPTLSAQLKKLEDQLGASLIERQPGNILLTRTGSAVVEKAREMLRISNDIQHLVAAGGDPLAGELRIGLIPTVGPYLLPNVVATVRKELPNLKCQYLEYQTDPLLARLHDGDIDLAILALPIDTSNLDVAPLYNETFQLAVHKSHELAGNKRVTLEDLSGTQFLLLEDGHCLRDQALEVCALSGITEQDGFRATSLETLRQMVAADAGMTLLPELAIHAPGANGGDITTIEFQKPAPYRTITGAWRQSSARSKAIAALLKSMRTALRNKLPALSLVAQ